MALRRGHDREERDRREERQDPDRLRGDDGRGGLEPPRGEDHDAVDERPERAARDVRDQEDRDRDGQARQERQHEAEESSGAGGAAGARCGPCPMRRQRGEESAREHEVHDLRRPSPSLAATGRTIDTSPATNAARSTDNAIG